MAETSGISWTDATFNPWRGCTKVSPECDRCYAETMSGRNPSVLGIWGNEGTRVVAAESYWHTPLKWNAKAAREGKRLRVFCCSLADVFEEWPGQMVNTNGERVHGDCDPKWGGASGPISMDTARGRLFRLIDSTPNLDWMLLTKRPENIRRMWPGCGWVTEKHQAVPIRPNVWLGTTAGLQATADKNVPELLQCEGMGRLLWVSAEPLLGPVTFHPWIGRLQWIITGGESGHGARPCHPDWVRNIRDECKAAGVAFHHKQWGEWVARGQYLKAKDVSIGALVNATSAVMRRDGGIDESLGRATSTNDDDSAIYRAGKKMAGRMLDGVVWDQFPA